jgi:oligo-alginate lyase
MRCIVPRPLALAAVFALAVLPLRATRDPWFPDGPVEPAIPHDQLLPVRVRTPQFPLKTARTLHSDAEVALARENIARYPAAKAVADHILAQADYWKAWSDEDLRDLVPSAEVPRSAEICAEGCPVHGRAVYEINGGSTYPWIVDPRHPFQVRCPIGGETYPDNDYGAYYRSGFRDKSLLKGKFVDDGWGWVGPDGKRYWFVAYANAQLWQSLDQDRRSIVNAIRFLGQAYLLTGNRVYAHKAAVLLRRVAEVYPNMNYEQQSREGRLMGGEGTRYPGKITNLIWESALVAPSLSEAYDDIWETIDGDAALQHFYHQSGEQIRGFIEANYLEEAIDVYFADKMRGNYGTHQTALLQLAVVRQHADTARYVAEVLHRGEGHMLRLGYDYGLYNLVFRDGNPHESPDYNFIWVRVLARSAELLRRLGYDLRGEPRLKRMFDAPLDFIATGSHSPAIGDSRTRYAPLIPDDMITYRSGLLLFGDPRYRDFLAATGAAAGGGFASYDCLFLPPLPPAPAALPGGRVVPPQPSHVLSGYGYVFLNNPSDTISMGLFYGLHVAHYHFDRLYFDIFANGQAMTPSLGYPDGANEFNPGIFTWSKTTVAHTTVTVDAHRQPANPEGRLALFADGSFARVITADAHDTYPQTSTYARTVVMVDVPGKRDRSYFVDFFDVVGGHQHDYSLHGPTGVFTALGGTWTKPARGTLAGPDVPLGALYDDPVRGAKDFKGSYLNYAGSGFQHLFNVQRLTAGAGDFVGEYAHDRDPNARIRIRILPQTGQELLMADARVSPVKFPERVKYLIARMQNAPTGPGLSSTFSAVLEPFSKEPFIADVRRVETPGATAVVVDRSDGSREIVIHRRAGPKAVLSGLAALPIETDALAAVLTIDHTGLPVRAFVAGAGSVSVGSWRIEAAPLTGTITSVDAANDRIRVRLDGNAGSPKAGQVIHLVNRIRDTVQTIVSVEQTGDGVWLGLKDDLRVGRIRVASVDGMRLTTHSGLRIFGAYGGVTLCDNSFLPIALVDRATGESLTLTGSASRRVGPGDDLWLVDGAVGETVRTDGVASWQAVK